MDWLYGMLHPVVRDMSRSALLSCAAAVAAAVFVGLQIFIDFIPDGPDSASVLVLVWAGGATGVWVLYQCGCFILIRAWVYPFLGRWACRQKEETFYDVRIRVMRGEIAMTVKGYDSLKTLQNVQSRKLMDRPVAKMRAQGRYSHYAPGELTVTYDLSNAVDVSSRYFGLVAFYEVVDRDHLIGGKARHQVMQAEWHASKGYTESSSGKEPQYRTGTSYFVRPEFSSWLEDFPETLSRGGQNKPASTWAEAFRASSRFFR